MTKLAIIMDPLDKIDPLHDSSFAMLVAAQARGWELYYLQQQSLFLEGGEVKATAEKIRITPNKTSDFYQSISLKEYALTHFDIVLMRKDPPVDAAYLYTTLLLEYAEKAGVLVINRPQALRDMNEKLAALYFREWCPETIVTSQKAHVLNFVRKHGDIVLKSLDSLAGRAVFYLKRQDPNLFVMVETLTQQGKEPIMAQVYLPEIQKEGDKRILLVDGKPIPYALARLPAIGDFRGNMAAGATTEALPLTPREQALCAAVGPVLQEQGLLFVGIDVIGGYLTEVNVTSPTGIQELDRMTGSHIATDFIECLETLLKSR